MKTIKTLPTNITTNLQDKELEQEFLRDILNPLSEDINHYIQAQDSALGDLDATIDHINWLASDNHCTLVITFDLHENYFNWANTSKNINAFKAMELAAHEACTATHALPEILSKTFDDGLTDTKYIITHSTLIFIATFEF